MLGTRTKQVFSYGRRSHRIISISEDHENDIANNSNNHKPADPWRTPAVKTKMRHHFPSESPSPQFVRVKNRTPKKRLPPPLSPASWKKKRTRVRQIVKGNVSAKSKVDATPTRRPLSWYHPNVPGSPVVRTKKNARVAGAKGTPLGSKLNQPFSPFMDMDIIVLDNDGRRISQERRVSRTDVVVNPPVREAAGGQARRGTLKKKQEPQVIVLSDSDDEQAAPKPPKRAVGRSKAVIISSDESEADEPIAAPPKPKTKSTILPISKAKPSQRLQVEVVISPIKRAVKPKPKYYSPPPELPPTPLARVQPKYVPLPIPQPRARQLTPIRRGGSKALFRTYSPTPTTPTDLDTSLDFDFANLTLSPSHAIQSIPPPEYLLPLLNECGQKTPHEFSAFIETFPFDPVVQPVDEDINSPNDVQFRKIGEASYSEVFGIGNVVLKVIPLRDDTSASAPAPISDIETPFPSEAKDVLKEMIVTRAMGAVCEGFVRLLKTYIVRGKYPEVLLALWDEYDNRKGSEGVRPDGFSVSQVYAIIVLPNGGPDLEAYTFAHPSKNGWRQACSLFWQVARTLARAEELVEFEHRDLHWGQILVKNTTTGTTKLSPRRKVNTRIPMDDASHGVETTIIDLGLARMDGGGSVHWTPFDEEIFEGEGDYQFDVYRMMRGSVGEEYRPITNVMWLHYLAFKLLHAKRLKPPGVPKKPTVSSVYTEREGYDVLVEVEAVLGKCIKDLKKRKGKKTVADGTGGSSLKSAGDVVKFGIGKEWVR